MNLKTCTLALAAAAGIAHADVIASYSFTDLDGTFDSVTSQFTATATSTTSLTTGGDVSSLIGSKGTAEYLSGFFGAAGFADVAITMDISNVTATSADAIGSVLITDLDGDTISASFSGAWTILNPFGFMFFNGVSSDYDFADNGTADGLFNGTSGAFSLADFPGIYEGAISVLLQRPGGFGGSFSEVSTQADGILIPTPGSILIAGIGGLGLIAPRRRR